MTQYKSFLFFLIILLFHPPIYSQWIKAYNPYNGYVSSLSFINSKLYAGSKGNLYISDNNGINWTSVSITDKEIDISSITGIDSTIFIGTQGRGIYISNDNGNSWAISNDGLTNMLISTIIITDSVVLTGTIGDGVFRSTDYGLSWTKSSNGITNNSITSMIIFDSLVVAGSSSGDIFHSEDSGINWNLVSSLNYSITSFTRKKDLLFAGSFGGGVAVSTDKGITWSQANNGLYNEGVTSLTSNDSIIYAGTDISGVFRSTNNGELWAVIKNGLMDSTITSLATNDSIVFAGTMGGGVFSSSNFGDLWNPMNTGLVKARVIQFVTHDENVFAATYGAGILLSTDKGFSWTELNSGLPSLEIISLAVKDSFIYAIAFNIGIFKSSDYGKNWIPTTPFYGNPRYLTISDSILYVSTSSEGIFRTTDGGNSWQNLGLERKHIEVIKAKDSLLLAGSFIYEGVFLSTNFGDDWTSLGSSYAYSSIEALGWCGDKIVAGIDNGVFFRENEKWIKKGSADGIYSMDIKDSIIVVGSWSGVHLSIDWGENWTKVDSGLIEPIYAIAIVGNNLFAGDLNENIWKRSIPKVITEVKEISSSSISEYNLYQNFPNPFNPSTKIEYKIPTEGLVTLKVFDILGREIITLVNEFQQSGDYNINFDASDLASGLYIYRLNVNNFSSVKKMIFIK